MLKKVLTFQSNLPDFKFKTFLKLYFIYSQCRIFKCTLNSIHSINPLKKLHVNNSQVKKNVLWMEKMHKEVFKKKRIHFYHEISYEFEFSHRIKNACNIEIKISKIIHPKVRYFKFNMMYFTNSRWAIQQKMLSKESIKISSTMHSTFKWNPMTFDAVLTILLH